MPPIYTKDACATDYRGWCYDAVACMWPGHSLSVGVWHDAQHIVAVRDCRAAQRQVAVVS